MSLDGLYVWLAVSSVAVIMGVAIEETPMVIKARKFFAFAKTHGHKAARSLLFARWEAVAESLGFTLLVVGLVGELGFQTLIESADATLKRESDRRIGLLQIAAAPRDVVPPQNDGLPYLGRHASVRILVKSYAFDAEAGRLADELIAELKAMNFAVADSSLTVAAAKPFAFGVYVSGNNQTLAKAVIMWLNESNLQAIERDPPVSSLSFGGETFTSGEPDITIFIGAKPISSVGQ